MKEMESLYGDAEGGGGTDQPAPEKAPEKKVEGHTELVSKKLLGIGDEEMPAPGTEFVLKLVKLHGDQAEVSYSTKEESKPETMSEDQQLAAMTE
jgi:hypothetical protein